MQDSKDLIIIGGGPAGLAAAIYAARYNLKTLMVVEKFGGQMANAPFIENYPGFEKIPGAELAQKISNQVKKLGVEILNGKVIKIKKSAQGSRVQTESGKELISKTILLTCGMERRKLGVPGEKELEGRGVSYCSTCDGPLFKGKKVAVIGGGDAGLASAFHLAQICPEVYVIEILPKLQAEPYWQEKIKSKKNVEILLATKVKKILGKEFVEGLLVEDKNNEKRLEASGVFVEIGSIPSTDLAKKLNLKLDEQGFIKIDSSGKTSLNGIWAAGDITTGSDKFWQILTAMAEGAIATHSIFKSLKK